MWKKNKFCDIKYNDEENFRPDITLFINGMSLVFIEVKRPNNYGGMIEETNRMNDIRFA